MRRGCEPYTENPCVWRAYGPRKACEMGEHGKKKGRHQCAPSPKSPANPMLQPTFPYPSSVRYPYDTHIYLGKKAKRRRFTEGYTANLRKKHTFGAGKDKAGIGPES